MTVIRKSPQAYHHHLHRNILMTHAHSLSLSHTHVHVHSHSAPLFLSVVFFPSDLLDFKHLLFQLFVRNSTSVRTSVDTIHHAAPYPYIHCKYNTHTSDHLITFPLSIETLFEWRLILYKVRMCRSHNNSC